VSLTYRYSASGTNGDNHLIQVGHAGDVTATLTPVGPVGNSTEWSGNLAGVVSINDRNEHRNSNPVVIETLIGSGAPTVGQGLSVFRLTVDPATCTYEFGVTPSVTMTLTTIADVTTVETGDLPVGVIQGGIQPLGAWRQLGLPAFDALYDAYPLVLNSQRAGLDTYFPAGFGPEQWVPFTLDARGSAIVDFTIVPHFP